MLWLPKSFDSVPLIVYGLFHRTGPPPQPPTSATWSKLDRGKMSCSDTWLT